MPRFGMVNRDTPMPLPPRALDGVPPDHLAPLRQKPPRRSCRGTVVFSALSLWVAVAVAADMPPGPPTTPEVEGSLHAFPVLRDLQGRRLADGEFTQWLDSERLWIRNTYDFGGDHRIEEVAVFDRATIAQEQWSWREFVAGAVVREYAVDLRTGEARARKNEGGEEKQWHERLEVEPGRTFAGIGFTTAIRRFRDRLVRGETLELRAVGFTAKPRLVTVRISHRGVEQMLMSGRRVRGDCFLIAPKIPAIARLLIAASDTRIWLTHPAPAGFLRWEGALVEPGDRIVRVDLLPGDPSGPAEPATPPTLPASAGR